MLDIRKIRENPDLFRERLARRNGGDEKLIAQVLALDEKRRKLLQEGEALKGERNRASKEIGAIKAKGGDMAENSAKMKAIGDEITADRPRTGRARRPSRPTFCCASRIINHDSVPVGKSAADNRIERVVGEPAEVRFQAQAALGNRHASSA